MQILRNFSWLEQLQGAVTGVDPRPFSVEGAAEYRLAGIPN